MRIFQRVLGGVCAYVANRDGVTAIEYGLIAGGIALTIVAVVFLAGDDMQGLFAVIQGKTAETAANAGT